MSEIKYRQMLPGEEEFVCSLANEVFFESVAPLYPQNGVREFQKTTKPEVLKNDCLSNGHSVFLALTPEVIIGVIKLKKINHISWFFVDGKHQRKGIGRGLISHAINWVLKQSPDIQVMTVNSSPNSYTAYETLGFSRIGNEKEVNGIRFTPYSFQLASEIKTFAQ